LYRIVIKGNKYSKTRVKSILNKVYFKKIAIFIVPITIALLLQWGQGTSYRFIIEDQYSIEILAYIATGLAIATAIFSAVENLSMQYFFPIYLNKITNSTKEKRTDAWNELSSYMIIIYVLLAAFIIALAPFLATILVAEQFYESYIFAMIGAMIELCRVLSNLVYKVSQSELKTMKIVMPYLIGFSVLVILLYSIDAKNQLWIIPAVLFFTYFLILVLLFISMSKLLPITVNYKIVSKAILMTPPFFMVYLLDIDISLMSSLAVVLIFGIYFLIAVWWLISMLIKGDNFEKSFVSR
jgi:O-antigen/teichoic acid export membrane protein